MKYWFIFARLISCSKERRWNLYDSLFRRESNPNKALDSHSQYYPDGRRNRGEDLHHS